MIGVFFYWQAKVTGRQTGEHGKGREIVSGMKIIAQDSTNCNPSIHYQLRSLLAGYGLPHSDLAVEKLLICYQHGLTFAQAARALLVMEHTTPITPCAGCNRPLGEHINHVCILDDAAFLLCPTCIQRGNADPTGAGVQIIRNATSPIQSTEVI